MRNCERILRVPTWRMINFTLRLCSSDSAWTLFSVKLNCTPLATNVSQTTTIRINYKSCAEIAKNATTHRKICWKIFDIMCYADLRLRDPLLLSFPHSLSPCKSLPKFRALLLVLRPFGQHQEKLINSTFYVCLPGGQISPLSPPLPNCAQPISFNAFAAHLFSLLLRCVTNNVEIKCYARGDKRRSLLLLLLLLSWKMKPH